MLQNYNRKFFQAALEKDKVKLHKYQEKLLKSDSAKLLAVRKVTQDNRGRKTAGIGGVILLKPEDRLKLAKETKLDGKSSPYSEGLHPEAWYGRKTTTGHSNCSRQSETGFSKNGPGAGMGGEIRIQ